MTEWLQSRFYPCPRDIFWHFGILISVHLILSMKLDITIRSCKWCLLSSRKDDPVLLSFWNQQSLLLWPITAFYWSSFVSRTSCIKISLHAQEEYCNPSEVALFRIKQIVSINTVVKVMLALEVRLPWLLLSGRRIVWRTSYKLGYKL